ncbi:MAG: response regulator transcription factor [Ruminococcaceae bacterium]|nr:response regulator transcription factor [Oscillospiraceae bacterium]
MSNNKYKILIIEDESNIRSFVQTVLEATGYQVITEKTCENGIMMFTSHLPDIVILDLGLPDQDGIEFIKTIRKNYFTPIIVLSARTSEEDKVAALELGANDYITKPFGTAELVARIKAAIRSNRIVDMESSKKGIFTLHSLKINFDTRIVTISDKEVHLTQTEFNILALLCQNSSKVMTYSEIINAIWGYYDDSSIKKLQVNMANLRKKLECKPGKNKYIINELGVGYRINKE